MKDTGYVRWLYRELTELVGQGVMQPEVAERFRKYYGEPSWPGG